MKSQKSQKFHYYFAYGSNMDARQMISRCPGAIPCGNAILPRHRLEFGGFSAYRGGGVATVVPDDESDVNGIVWALSTKDLETLDRFEGAPTVYSRHTVQIYKDGAMVPVLTYKLIEDKVSLPSLDYWKQIRRVYQAQRWDVHFLDELKGEDQLIFIYGSLRRGASNHGLMVGADFVREAVTEPKFKMLDLGSYPGMVAGKNAIKGEIWRVNQLKLTELDRFEGHPIYYRRKPIKLQDGEEVMSYIFAHVPKAPRVITSGDWMNKWSVSDARAPKPPPRQMSLPSNIKSLAEIKEEEEGDPGQSERVRALRDTIDRMVLEKFGEIAPEIPEDGEPPTTRIRTPTNFMLL